MADQATGTGWIRWHTVGLVAIVALMIVVGYAVGGSWGWLLNLVLLTVLAALLGHGITGRLSGLLIGERNAMSLSRFQLVAWTVVVLSALFTAVFHNLAAGVDPSAALTIAIPGELWALMGISTASLVGSPLILSNKRAKKPSRAEKQQLVTVLAAAEGVEEQEITERKQTRGHVLVNTSPADAKLSDLFRGEEVGNAALLDLGKVQMFYFTIILLATYGLLLGRSLEGDTVIAQFPALGEGMVTLLGISHAGYLANKAAPHSGAGAADEADDGTLPLGAAAGGGGDVPASQAGRGK